MYKRYKKYSKLKSSDYIFAPVAFEPLGPWAKEVKEFIGTIGSRLDELTGSNVAGNFVSQRIYLASHVMETLPPTTRLDEVFFIFYQSDRWKNQFENLLNEKVFQ